MKKRCTDVIALACALSTSACAGMLGPSSTYQANPQLLALSPAVVFQGSAGSLSYQSAVGRDGQRYLPAQRVRGRACQRGVQIPILSLVAAALGEESRRGPGSLSAGWGDGSFSAAIDDARRRIPRGAILYDVRADLHRRSILTVYLEQCVTLDAGVLVPSA
jgi:hypothetical protein